MESASLFFIASSMSVMFGWQPLPDADSMEGEQKIEYIVQLEPELVATMKEGQSIPITSDIPDDIGPIGRIRIVVGREDLPKENLVTRFKPWPKKLNLEKLSLEKTAREGLVETQFTVPPVQSSSSERYGNQTASNNPILPPDGNSVAADPFGRALQQGAQRARELAPDVNQQILPRADQLFGQGGPGSQSVRNAIDDTTNQLRRDSQRGVEQVADRAEQQLSDTVHEFGHSLTPERSILSGEQNQNSNAILPPINNNPLPPTTIAHETPPPSHYGNHNNQPPTRNSQWPNKPSDHNALDLTNRPKESTLPRYPNNLNPKLNTASVGMEGSQFPSTGSGSQATSLHSADTSWDHQLTPPEIRLDMLKEPVSYDVHNASNTPRSHQEQIATRLPLNHRPPNTQSRDVDRNQNSDNPAYDNRAYDNADSNSNKSLFPLLLSWVLLSGSVVGNVYLLWSFVDVRSKYQGMVHGNSGRRGRYDD